MAGNTAVSRLITVSRYEAGEHAQFGSADLIDVGGVKISQSELISMGDFYGTVDDLLKADPAELTRLVALIRRDRDAYKKMPGVTAVSNAEWEAATGGRFLKLAAANVTHFAPPKSGSVGTDNEATFRALHTRALQAVLPGKVTDEAKIINAFACHFLTDAFSAGHLIAKSDVMDEARKYWAKVPTTGWAFKESSFTKEVARLVLLDPGASAKLANKEIKFIAWGDVTEERFSELIMKIEERMPDKFFNAFARVVHDKLDEAIKGGPGSGIEVTNRKGHASWRLSGDSTLSYSPETLSVARQAVAESLKNLDAIALRAPPSTPGGAPPDYKSMCDMVWAYTPVPTAAGSVQINDTVAKFADASKPECVRAFAELTIAELDLAISELTSMGYMRDRPGRPPAGTKGPGGTYVPGQMPGGAYIDEHGHVTVPGVPTH
jgi:hypothetical protein